MEKGRAGQRKMKANEGNAIIIQNESSVDRDIPASRVYLLLDFNLNQRSNDSPLKMTGLLWDLLTEGKQVRRFTF